MNPLKATGHWTGFTPSEKNHKTLDNYLTDAGMYSYYKDGSVKNLECILAELECAFSTVILTPLLSTWLQGPLLLYKPNSEKVEKHFWDWVCLVRSQKETQIP